MQLATKKMHRPIKDDDVIFTCALSLRPGT